jgi:hypothetical protein
MHLGGIHEIRSRGCNFEVVGEEGTRHKIAPVTQYR